MSNEHTEDSDIVVLDGGNLVTEGMTIKEYIDAIEAEYGEGVLDG